MIERRPTSNSFISQRLRLHYVDWGNAGAEPLVLVHGGRDHCRNWDWVAERLADRYHIIAPDLRGHGDSMWSPDGDYSMLAFVHDLAQLVHQLERAPVKIIAHSLGGGIALRFAGLYPELVSRIVAIEGLGPSPAMLAERRKQGTAERIRRYIADRRAASGRAPKKYASFAEALERMQAENSYLSAAQAEHLTRHAISRNEDGSWSWKFDNYMRVFPPYDLPDGEIEALWAAIACPTLLCYGEKSWASNPEEDGRAVHFRNARVVSFADAGHWLHHDQFERFMAEVEAFL
ncbi:MAG: alpha/beta hydrolase [Alphaproteobacteria bacterium PA4]|nr:MAG: alpha/beta hydrolase [Alphaproteobacteria bacterium PA4]